MTSGAVRKSVVGACILAVVAIAGGALAQPAPGTSPADPPGSPGTTPPSGPVSPADPNAPPAGEAPPPPLEESPMTAEPPPPAYPDPAPGYAPSEPPPPPAEEPDEPSSAGPFARGSLRLSVLVGTGYSSSSDTYLILGAGLGYFLVDGLEVGVDWDIWLLEDPVLNRLSPGVKYVLHMVPVVKPYVGTFYRHTFVADYDDFDYVGARAGAIVLPKNNRFYVGLGAVYEHMLDCEDSYFVECDSVYPEIMIGIGF